MLSYFQSLYDYFSLISIITPYIIYGYLWLFSITFSCFCVFHLKLHLIVLLMAIGGYFNNGYWWLVY
jgi:hypothetical protein